MIICYSESCRLVCWISVLPLVSSNWKVLEAVGAWLHVLWNVVEDDEFFMIEGRNKLVGYVTHSEFSKLCTHWLG